MENNLSETAYIKKIDEIRYQIRWFTPTTEVDLCGHATLASAYVLFNHLGYDKDEIIFVSQRSGELKVTNNKETGYLTLNFPTDTLEEINNLPEFSLVFDVLPKNTFKGKTDYMLVFENQQQIAELNINFSEISNIKARGIIVTAPGDKVDFVSRFFGCGCGIDEDPVTGSAHTSLAPYWSTRLNKTHLKAIQLSARTGTLFIEYNGDRVNISGKSILYLIGDIFINS